MHLVGPAVASGFAFSPALKVKLEGVVEDIIDLLDLLAGDPDLEPSGDAEAGCDDDLNESAVVAIDAVRVLGRSARRPRQETRHGY